MGVYVIAVLRSFSSGISVIWILMCGILVSSSPAVCGFSSFWLTVFGKRKRILHRITVLFIWPLLSNVGQYFEDFRLNGKWIHNFWQLLYDEIGRTSNDLAFRSLYRPIHVFSRRLRLISGVFMLEIKKKKHARWIQCWVSVTDRKCGIGFSSIFDTLFRYLPILRTVLRYWVPPNVPLHWAKHFFFQSKQ